MHKRTLIAWLNDAYAMETQLLPTLRSRAAAHAALYTRCRIEQHIRETEGHAERLRQALSTLGCAPSLGRSGIAPLSRMAMTISRHGFSDAVTHDAIANYAAEQFEVAAYTALIAAAEHVGEVEVARLCRHNRSEDEEMAEWLEAQIAILILQSVTGAQPTPQPDC